MTSTVPNVHETIGLVAHDHKKQAPVEWARCNMALLERHDLVAIRKPMRAGAPCPRARQLWRRGANVISGGVTEPMDEIVQAEYVRIREQVWDRDEGDDNDDVFASLPELDRAIYVTRELEEELADGGWYLVFANEDESLIEPAIAAYELLGLEAHAAHLRDVLAGGYGDLSSEDDGDRLDETYRALTGAEAARRRALDHRGS
jgi:hypothetical protein